MEISKWRLYVITPPGRNLNYENMVEEAILGGADVVQFRAPALTDREYYQTGRNLSLLTKKYNIPLIVNNRLDLALAIGADGLHFGQNDLPIKVVKKFLSTLRPASAKATAGRSSLFAHRFLVGVSTHSLKQALQAEKDGADYISIGPIFSTPLKPEYEPLGIRVISKIKKRVKIPFFAIGGINQNNLEEVLRAGGERIAVIRAVFGQGNIRKKTKELKKWLTRKS